METNARLINAERLQSKLLTETNLRVVDCRFDLMRPEAGRAMYIESHIPGAVHADLDRNLAGTVTSRTGRHPLPDCHEFYRFLMDQGISNDSAVVVYDQQSGALAARLWWMLQWVGHTEASILDGGYSSWTAGGFTTESGTTSVVTGSFAGHPDDRGIISTPELVRQRGKHCCPPLVDARDADRFLGLREPIDTVAGHVPGAVNFPVGQSIGDDGFWLPPDELERRWATTISGGREAPWIAMCGSGVTACHLAFSAQYAGFRAPQVYVGSWSEWIRDPHRPVAPKAA